MQHADPAVVVRGLSCPAACGIFLDRGQAHAPALAGGFSTTGQPAKSPLLFFFFNLMRFCVCKHGFCKQHLRGCSDRHSWGGVSLSGPGRGPHSCLIPAGLRGGLGGQAGSGKLVEPVAVAHPGPEGAQGLAGGDPAYSGQLPATSWNLEKGTASFWERQALGLVGAGAHGSGA